MQASNYKVHARAVEFQIAKEGKGEVWPRLLVSPQKPGWLKIDFDHLVLEDEEEDSESDAAEDRNIEAVRNYHHVYNNAVIGIGCKYSSYESHCACQKNLFLCACSYSLGSTCNYQYIV